MPTSSVRYRTWPAQLAVLVVLLPLAWLAAVPGTSAADVAGLQDRYAFSLTPLPRHDAPAGGVVFGINPSVAHIRHYLYGIGASVALGDADGDGLANDLCWSDVRTKTVSVQPAPGTGDRYPPFEPDLRLPPQRTSRWPTLCRMADLNEDGWMDLIVGVMGGAPQLFLRRPDSPGPAASAYHRVEIDLGDVQWAYYPTLNIVDLDADGHLDLVLGAYFPDDIGLYDPTSTDSGELQDGFARARNGGTNRVFLWQAATSGASPTVTYQAIADPFPDDSEGGWTLALGSGDLDLDGRADLYVANDFGPDALLWNRSTPGNVQLELLRGRRSWTEPPSKTLGHDSFKGMGVDWADVTGDGLLDLYVSNIGSDFALHEGHFLWTSTGDLEGLERGVAPYVDRGEALGVAHSAWAWGAKIDDFDNDGVAEIVQATGFLKGQVNRWPAIAQLAIANDHLVSQPMTWPVLDATSDIDGWDPNPFWSQGADGRYVDLSEALLDGYTSNARGLATGDIDGDGDLDLVIANHDEDSVLLRNEGPDPGAFLGLHVLRAPTGAAERTQHHPGHPSGPVGSPAVGALVAVTGPEGLHAIRHVDLSNGHTGARSPDLLFGLGDTPRSTALDVQIAWRDTTGTPRTEHLTLSGGWHTVILGAP